MKKLLLITLLLSACTNLKEGTVKQTSPLVQTPPKQTQVIIKVTATMYYPVAGQCDSTPLITAGNYHISPKHASKQKYIAVSRDLLKVFKYGDKVKITNAGHKDGTYKVVDTMNKRFKSRIDFLESEGTALYKLKDVILTKI